LEGERSWFVLNVELKAAQALVYQNFAYNIWSLKKCIANLLNGCTPDGSAWTIDYQFGHLFINGTLGTRGTWTRMTNNCTQ
jgi:hypothetical protein